MYLQNMTYHLTIRKRAVKALLDMPARYARHIRQLLERLAEDPDRGDMALKPLPGNRGFKLLSEDHRIILDRDDEARRIEVLHIGARADVRK